MVKIRCNKLLQNKIVFCTGSQRQVASTSRQKKTNITIKIRSGKRFFFSRRKIAAARRKTMFACLPNQLMLEDRTCLQEKVGVLSALNVNLHACKLILVQLLLDTHSELRCEFTACDICIAPPIVFTR